MSIQHAYVVPEPPRICAAVAAAAGALRAAGLGTAARGPPPQRRRPHKYAGVLEPHTRVKFQWTNGLSLLSLLEWVFEM